MRWGVRETWFFRFGLGPLKAALLGCMILGLFCQPSFGQSNSGTAHAVTTEQVNALIDAISDAVVAKLQKTGALERPSQKQEQLASPAQAAPPGETVAFLDRVEAMLGGYPELGRNLARLPVLLDKTDAGGWGLVSYAVMLCLVLVLAIGSELLVRRVLAPARRRMSDRLSGVPSHWPLLHLAGLDALGVAALWLVGVLLSHIFFRHHDEQARFALAALSTVVFWQLCVLLLRVFFRPDLAAARLVPVDDGDASALQSRLVLVIGVVLAFRLVFRTLQDMGTPSEALAAWQFSVGFIAVGLLAWAMHDLRLPIERWLCSLSDGGNKAGRFWTVLGRHWLVFAVPMLVGLWLAQIYGALIEDPLVPGALLLTLGLFFALLLFETLVRYVRARQFGYEAPASQFGDAVVRTLRAAVYLMVLFTLADVWIVDVLELVDSTQWPSLTHAAITSAGVLFAAYACWEAIEFLTNGFVSRKAPLGSGAAGDEAAPPPSATRLATILPVLRAIALIGLIAVSALVVLDELGVNITPLVAVVSVFGLAMSFGSQTLVRDIVSGVFYLADDAFRVGEYIDCGKAKGTVEGFTLRSIRLRHQNGQIYTIPFGQLGQITNFSRDWCDHQVQSALRPRHRLEKLRKTVKKVGLEMLEDPEFKDEFLEPLKLQGVADIADNALIMRFKFTCKPNIPTRIQREAMKRLFPALQAAGLEFASATVSVQTIGDAVDTHAAAGAAATTLAAP